MPKKAEEMVSKIKADLKKQHPNWNKEKISSIAYGTVTKIYKNKGMKAPFT